MPIAMRGSEWGHQGGAASFGQRLRMLPPPFLDRLHRCSIGRELAALDQHARDRPEWLSVLVGVSDAHDAAFGETDAARALDLQEERLDGIVNEDELLAGQRRCACFDLLSRPVRNYALALDAATQPLVLELGVELDEVDRQQIVRRRVERITVLLALDAAAVEQRLVITRGEAGVLAVRGERLVCGKMP